MATSGKPGGKIVSLKQIVEYHFACFFAHAVSTITTRYLFRSYQIHGPRGGSERGVVTSHVMPRPPVPDLYAIKAKVQV